MHQEKEISMKQTYQLFLEAGLGAKSPETLDGIVDDHLMGFGSTIDEKIFNLAELKELVIRQKEQSKDVNLSWEIKPLSHYTSADDNTAFFADDIFLYANVGTEKIEIYLRFSVVLSYVNNKWKVIHWHASKPENVQSEEDTFGIESWKQKTAALEQLVEQRTADLVQKNRELEIETALERVRVVAMSMTKPDDLLNICKIQFIELKQLGFTEIRNALIGIFHDDENFFMDYDFSDYSGGHITRIPYNKNPLVDRSVRQMKTATDAFTEFAVGGEELKQWKKFREENGEYDDARLKDTDTLYYYFYSINAGSIGISTFQKISEDQLVVLKKFRNVFDLAYQRYVDITYAEGQAREARIETALERVRAVAMAMRKSEEVLNVCEVMYRELLSLGFSNIRNAQIALRDQDKRSYLICAYSDHDKVLLQEAPFDSSPIVKDLYDELEKSKDAFYQREFSGQQFEEWRKWREGLTPLKDERERSATSLCFYLYSIGKGHLGISTYDPITKQQVEVIKRFKTVFELSYRRYMDVALAEAQTKEARIEAALEKVRSRSLAVHQSDEFKNVITIVFEKLEELGIAVEAASINIFNEGSKDLDVYACGRSENGLDIRMVRLPYFDHPIANDLLKAHMNGEFFVGTYKKEEKNSYYEYLFEHSDIKHIPAEIKQRILQTDRYSLSLAPAKNSVIIVNNFDGTLLSQGEIDIVKRFSRVFEQAYTRFLDLQKAEAQSREAKIEAALEKVRSRSLAMQKSEELKDVIQVVYNQMVHLGILVEHAGFIIDYKERDDMHIWLADTRNIPSEVTIPYFDSPHWNSFIKAKASGQNFFANQLSFEEKNKFYKDLFKLFDVPADAREYYLKSTGLAISTVLLDDVALYIENFSAIPYSEEENAVLMRFGKVFQQTYTRFLDLKRAEAQSRENQIQLALERVRARTMAMQKSEELPEAANLLFQQIQSLGMAAWSAGYCIWEKDKQAITLWMSSEGVIQPPFRAPLTEDPSFIHMREAYERGETFHVEEVGGKELKAHYAYMRKLPVVGAILDSIVDAGHPLPGFQIFHCAYFSNGFLLFITYEPLPEAHDIFKRFGKVFDQTYTRFLDLQKAEAQAKEASIEAALEKVRSRSLAMHKSEELLEVINVVSEQLRSLGLHFDNVSFAVNSADYDMEFWMSIKARSTPIKIHAPFLDNPITRNVKEAKAKGLDVFSDALSHQENREWMQHLFDNANLKLSDERTTFLLNAPGYWRSTVILQNILFFVGNYENGPYTEEENVIFKRFATVFEQSYTRFLDLQKSEMQARESQIETGLEKVRSRTLAMQKSHELGETAAVVFKQLVNLGIAPNRLYIGIIKDESGHIEFWVTDEDGTKVSTQFIGDASKNLSIQKMYEGWKQEKKSLTITMEGQELEDYFHYLNDELHVPFRKGLTQKRRVQTIAYFGKGFIGIASPDDQPFETTKLLERFAAVFNLTYTRFSDLQTAEAQTKEARIEAALERVRARALAMQQPEELKDVAAVLRQEMGILGVEELETSIIYISDEQSNKTECWYALKDRSEEKRLITDHFPLDLEKTWVGREMMKFSHSDQKQISIEMQGANREEWIRYCESRSIPLRGYYGDSIPDRTYHLYKFSHGAIGAAAAGEISNESWNLLKRTASVFSLAYSRFKDLTQAKIDLQKLKEEKKRAEDALTELKVTQKQLIQSEKMASLGELTAGIAHEIQNPLNFVNNFSEVSKELLEEMKTELDLGNSKDAVHLAEDVIQNLEKINHHGKRADAIVKGMLQHSRATSPVKELTDLNHLADEYLRLCFHGLRAKDKAFKSAMVTDYDPNLPKINMIPQDIGRVILNLLTNAFYAVNEKNLSMHTVESINDLKDYEPTVSIITKQAGDKAQLMIVDNGNGMPQKLLDKIFQPFFTTKPTGQGTGLGLSLSYDIITKGHGGNLTVTTQEGKGSEFIIELPLEKLR